VQIEERLDGEEIVAAKPEHGENLMIKRVLWKLEKKEEGLWMG
jgi:hypothetical protein